MVVFRWLSLLLLVSLVTGCGKPLPTLEGFDKEAWITDPKGCLGKRKAMTERVRSEKEKLLALDEMKIVALLGKPDVNQLYKRNQKFYHYYIDDSSQCGGVGGTSSKLVIRFNAMGLATEASLE
jgi:hypothetical protein